MENNVFDQLLANTPGSTMDASTVQKRLAAMVNSELAKDTSQVATAATVEAVRQHVGAPRAETLIEAYNRFGADLRDGVEITKDYVERLTGMVEPDNHGRFRTHPITFMNGGSSAHHSDIHRLLDALFEHGGDLSPEEFTKEYLWIHPSSDGNGRTGWLLYNWRNGTLAEPVKLPRFF